MTHKVRPAGDDARSADVRPCPQCGQSMVEGSVGFPILGASKFNYRLRTVDISVEIAAHMCESCGFVMFQAPDPRPIREARAALGRARQSGSRRMEMNP